MRLRAAAIAALISPLLAGCASAQGPAAPRANPAADVAAAAAPAPDRDYLVYVVSESADKVSLLRFGPAGARVEREVNVGIMLTDPDGPHGVAVSPDRRHYYVSTAHGSPFGTLWKYAVDGDSVVGQVQLGNFPASLQLTPDGEFAYVVNFNLHGEMVPSSVSVVATGEMIEVARITTCVMPHGSRINAMGTRQYSACMMDDMLVEVDTRSFGVARHFMLGKGNEHGMSGPPGYRAQGGGEGHAAHGMAGGSGAHGPVSCSPTWAQPSADGARVYVACNKSNDIAEVDVAEWKLLRRLPAGDGVYNLAASRDGKLLVATNKRGQSVSVFDLSSGRELARIPTRRKVVHGVVISPDDRYAFVSVEGVGSEPGTVEVVDLRALRTVAAVDVRQQAGGIDFLRTESVR